MPPSVPLTQEPSLTRSSVDKKSQHLEINPDKIRAEVSLTPLDKRRQNVGKGRTSRVKESYRRRKDESEPVNKTGENLINDDVAQTTQDTRPSDLTNYNSSMMGYGGMGMGMGMSPMSPYSSPYGMMGMGMGMGPTTGPLASFNQLLFGFQSLVCSLGQAMQILGMNTQALHQLYGQGMTMLDNILNTLHEINTLENASQKQLSEEDKKRRRRLKALRWSILVGGSYVGYRVVANWIKKRREFKRIQFEGDLHRTNRVAHSAGSVMIPPSTSWQHHGNQYGSEWSNTGAHNTGYYGGLGDPVGPHTRFRPTTPSMYSNQYQAYGQEF